MTENAGSTLRLLQGADSSRRVAWAKYFAEVERCTDLELILDSYFERLRWVTILLELGEVELATLLGRALSGSIASEAEEEEFLRTVVAAVDRGQAQRDQLQQFIDADSKFPRTLDEKAWRIL